MTSSQDDKTPQIELLTIGRQKENKMIFTTSLKTTGIEAGRNGKRDKTTSC
jgi:hypothetical protein